MGYSKDYVATAQRVYTGDDMQVVRPLEILDDVHWSASVQHISASANVDAHEMLPSWHDE